MATARHLAVAATTTATVLLGSVLGTSSTSCAALTRANTPGSVTSPGFSAAAVRAPAPDASARWTLVRSTGFSTAVTDAGRRWSPSDDGPGSRYDADGYDDGGAYFDATGGYTLETSGVFAHVGRATLRYHRDFVEDGVPIWHYNQTAAEYDGSFNRDWSYAGDHGTYTDSDVWPAGSAYRTSS